MMCDASAISQNTLGERIFAIGDTGQIETLWRADRPTGRPIASRECGADIAGGPGTCAHSFQSANKAAHLIVQKGSRAHIKAGFGAMWAICQRHV